MSESKRFFTYLLECGDGTYYAGWTTDLQKRLETHNAGLGAKYTRARLPVILRKTWDFDTRNEAMRFEAHIKRLPRAKKQALLEA